MPSHTESELPSRLVHANPVTCTAPSPHGGREQTGSCGLLYEGKQISQVASDGNKCVSYIL